MVADSMEDVDMSEPGQFRMQRVHQPGLSAYWEWPA